ncbi:MAG: Membrane-bound lytic murein transglycosylase D precursor [Cytophagales bacterium]|jgi:membrane-bound lytic murein transglycosylase D|nr:LysM peptidoglycan-binding domain-containing protein [Bacteroidota bacterium]MBS1982025.1 LysM peptidoglycan-binding domain-containing protein [Bacteroidota bacterium]WHZ09482.1 MAG: Membrane-bound lytic murein transglycosylase D precursor [Cytophagales bacterium]
MRFFAAALIFFGVAASHAQTPEVPHKMHFAGMSLTIRDDARREIQQDVDALVRPGRYYEMKVERAKTYFPIIEKIFSEENLPQDFKYLCLQESALVSDAVSVSNAVGFWQFKDYTAQEMGLRVDDEVDERMNIVSASRGAARYLKQSNTYFNNWLLALQAYQMGTGGVRRSIGDKFNGDSHMIISSDTYWYVKKYLAHKIAFENAIVGEPKLKVSLYEMSDKKLSRLASEVSIDENLLLEYNKWARRGLVPGDKQYSVAIPSGSALADFNNLVINSPKASKAIPITKLPINENLTINGLKIIVAQPGETVAGLAARSHIDISKFVNYNDISIDHEIKAGAVYFLEKKKKRSEVLIYKSKMGDDLWLVSQLQGIRLKNLKKLNPKIGDGLIAGGTLVRLNKNALSDPPQQLQPEPSSDTVLEVASLSNESFAWQAQPQPQPQLIESQSNGNQLKPSGQDFVPAIKTQAADSVNQSNPQEPKQFTYVVKNSDTLYSIARQFGATIKELMDWNKKTSLSISVGEKLLIVKK